jgi:hypothetical protein
VDDTTLAAAAPANPTIHQIARTPSFLAGTPRPALASSTGTATDRREKHSAPPGRLGSTKGTIDSDHVAGQTEHHGMHVSAPLAAEGCSGSAAEKACSADPELKEE